MPVRTGKQFIDGLKAQKREVWLDGKRVEDVTTHPAFAGPVQSLARLYDMQHEAAHRDILTYPSPTTGDAVGTAFMVPHGHADLVKRREAFRLWSEATMGMMGRSPDFLNTTLMAMAEAKEVFARKDPRYAENVVRYYEYVRENDLFLTHALITPQIDRSRTSHDQHEEYLHLGVVRQTSEGLILRGARMIATLGPIADEILVYNLPGLKPGDEKYSMIFAIPVGTKGLKQICREPYETGGRSAFNHPLATRFEEMDTLTIFDDVLVPWDRVFNHDDVAAANAMYPDTNIRQHTAHQTGVRGLVKMQMVLGVTMEVAKAIGADRHLHVQEMLGEAINYVELVRAAVLRSEYDFETTPQGSLRTMFRPLQTVRTFMPRVYPRMIEILQTIGAGGFMSVPMEGDLTGGAAADVARYYQGAGGMPAREKVALFKLAWDLCGDAFGMRQMQYERYYAGDPVRTTAGNYLGYDFRGECERLVEMALALTEAPAVDRIAAE